MVEIQLSLELAKWKRRQVLGNALLPKLISGDLRVKDAERFSKEKGL